MPVYLRISRKGLLVALAVAASSIGEPSFAQQRHIPRVQIEEMFLGIQANTLWDMKGNMLWGYFFVSSGKENIEKIGADLKHDGYGLVGVSEIEAASPFAVRQWRLHVEKIETHTIDTLQLRNRQLEDMASRYGAVVYDGMDVGPANRSGR